VIVALSSTTLRVVLRRAFLVLYALCLTLGAVGFAAVTVVNRRLDDVAQTLQPLAADNDAVLIDLVDAETGLRGFLLTGQRSFLAPYTSGAAGFPAALRSAEARAAGHPRVSALLRREDDAATAWLSGYARPVLARPGSTTTSLDERGRDLIDRFRSANAAVDRRVDFRIGQASTTARDTRNAAFSVLGALVTLILVAGTWFALRILGGVVPPLEDVTRALRTLAASRRGAAVPERGTAELVELARAVNHLDAENERRHTLELRRERMQKLAVGVAREVAERLDIDDVLRRCVTVVAAAFGVDRVLLRLVEGDRLGPVVAEWHRPDLRPVAGLERPEMLERFLDDLLARQECFVANDLDAMAGGSAQLLEYFGLLGATASVTVPLVDGSDLVGGVALLQVGRGREWQSDEIAAMRVAAADLARAISHAKLFEAQTLLVKEYASLDQAKADFVSTVSHELNTPLTSIRGYVEMLQDRMGGDASGTRHMLDVVARNTGRLQGLVEDLLTLSKVEAKVLPSRRDPVGLDDVVDTAVTALRPQAASAGVVLDAGGAASGAVVAGDADQLERVVLNLLSNAVKFTPAGGRVKVAAGLVGDAVELTVADTGMGIPADEQQHLGERFFRASNAGYGAVPGTGLGLRVVYGLVEHHGGTVALHSAVGRGTTFVVTLPTVAGGVDVPGERVEAQPAAG
jgi:two-component system phosphate regulon sensor histidine kinase PhoR